MIDIPGLPVPDAGPIFDVALAVHIAAGITAVLAGLLAMLGTRAGVADIGRGASSSAGSSPSSDRCSPWW